jgi:hypothetical protein
MNHFEQYNNNLNKLFNEHSYFKDVAIKRHNLFILFPDLQNYTQENKDIYATYFEKSNDFNILINDILHINSQLHKSFYKDDKTNIQIKINNIQLNKIKQTLSPNYIDEIDFNEYLNDFIQMIFESYGQYGKQSNGQYLSIEQINNKSREYSLFDIDYKNPLDKQKYENFKLILEIRNIQIKLYRKLYDLLNDIYEQLFNTEINITEIYKNIDNISTNYLNDLLLTVYNKYINDINNVDLYNVLLNNNIYISFIKNYNISLDKLKKEIIYIYQNKNVKYNTINDMEFMIAYLYNKYNLISKIPNEFQSDEITIINNMIDNIKKFGYEYHINKGNITKIDLNKYNILYEIDKINFTKERFIQHYVYPEVELLDYSDQTNIDDIIYSKKNHPKYRNYPYYNILCDKLNKYIIDNDNQYIVFGLNSRIKPFKFCQNHFIGDTSIVSKKKIYHAYYDLTIWSPFINKFFTKTELIKKQNRKIKALYKTDITTTENCIDKSDLPTHYAEEIEQILQNNITDIVNNYIYLGITIVPTNKNYSKHDLFFFIFWNKQNNMLLFVDLIGNKLIPPIILYYPFITYAELIQISKYLKDNDNSYNFYKKDDNDMIYISPYDTKTITTLNNLQEYQLDTNNTDDSRGTIRKISLCKKQIGGKQYFITKKQNKIYEYSTKIATKYGILFKNNFSYQQNIIPKKDIYNVLNYIDPYLHLYESKGLKNLEKNNKNIDDIIKQKNPYFILNYKVNNEALFFWEMNYKHHIIEEQFNSLYEITNVSFINKIITIINDKMFPDKELDFNTIYLNNLDETIIHKKYTEDKFNKIKNNKFNINSFNDFEKNINHINSIDFLYLHINILQFNNNHIKNRFTSYLSNIYTILYFSTIIEKLNEGSNVCIILKDIFHIFDIKMITIFAYLFDDFIFDVAECNSDRRNFFYVILKHRKKNINQNYIEQIKNLAKSFYYPNDLINENTNNDDVIYVLKKHSNIINQIILTDSNLINLKNKIIKQINDINVKWYINAYNLKVEMNYFYNKDRHNEITDDIKEEYRKKNIFKCIQWSKKYDFPLIPSISFEKFDNDFRKHIYKDIVSFEDDVLFKLKKHNTPDPNFSISKNINFKHIPEYYKLGLVKFNSETRALDYRDMNVYHQVKVQMDYYHKKITKVIVRQFKLHDNYISQAWLKMTEMLHHFDLINKNNKDLKTFHLCELPGAFINAIRFFIEKNTHIDINKWNWIAQSLNPAKLKDFDERKAFGDEANLLKKYPNNYDFGIGETGDITDFNNILYYKKNHGNNDFVTADCGLPLTQKVLSYKLTFSMYLAVFATLKKGGNCIIKRNVPIDNNQEIYMLYLFYQLFEKVIMYKPRLNYQSQEYYLIGFNYSPIDDKLFNQLIDFLKKYDLVGLIDLHDIDEKFLLQLDKGQHLLLDNLNHFIKKKIFFADNFNNLNDKDWEYINKAIDEKIKEWLDDFHIINTSV